MTAQAQFYWTAKNNSNYLAGYRSAATLLGAARSYVENELLGEGTLYIYQGKPTDLHDVPCRIDEKSIITKFRWKTIEE